MASKKDIKTKYGDEVVVSFEDTKSDNKEAVKQPLANCWMWDEADVIITAFTGPSVAIALIVLEKNKGFVYAALTPKPMEANQYSLKFFLNAYDECKEAGRDRQVQRVQDCRWHHRTRRLQPTTKTLYPQSSISEVLRLPARIERHERHPNQDRDLVDFIVSLGTSRTSKYFAEERNPGVTAAEYCGNKNDCFETRYNHLERTRWKAQ